MTRQEATRTLALLQDHFISSEERDGFAERIVLGVVEHCEEIDRIVETYSENWRLDRMTIIDRNILRIATFELLYCSETPPKVVLNEAIDLGKRFGSDDSGSFINGILDRVQRDVVRKNESQCGGQG